MRDMTPQELWELEQEQDKYEHSVEITSNAMANHFIASHGILRAKLRQFAWYVRGPHSLTLRRYFYELIERNDDCDNMIAEVMLSVGAKPYATTSQYVDMSFVKEDGAEKYLTAAKMVECLLSDYRMISATAGRSILLANEEKFPTMAWVLSEYRARLDRTIYELAALVDQDPFLKDDDDDDDDD